MSLCCNSCRPRLAPPRPAAEAATRSRQWPDRGVATRSPRPGDAGPVHGGLDRGLAGLSAPERARNLSGRVRLRRDAHLHPRAVTVLIDDVITTGTTAAESARVLPPTASTSTPSSSSPRRDGEPCPGHPDRDMTWRYGGC